jgi:hypothetical protein
MIVAAASTAEAQSMPLTCNTTAQTVSGGPGATVTATCPSGCNMTVGSLWGTTVYSDDSTICPAAIHAGVLSTAGGEISITIEEGRASYPASTQNGVTSAAWGQWNRSFSVRSGIPGAPPVEMGISCASTAQTLPGGPGTGHSLTCPPGCTTQTIWGTWVYSDDSAICTSGG